jgi:hypothetical protein
MDTKSSMTVVLTRKEIREQQVSTDSETSSWEDARKDSSPRVSQSMTH